VSYDTPWRDLMGASTMAPLKSEGLLISVILILYVFEVGTLNLGWHYFKSTLFIHA
jgi:hypothetical protein